MLKKLRRSLDVNDVRCWFFPDHAKGGVDIEENIDKAVRNYDKLVVICSKNSLNSEPVLDEIERALQKERELRKKDKTKRVLFPIIIDDYLLKKWNHPLKARVDECPVL